MHPYVAPLPFTQAQVRAPTSCCFPDTQDVEAPSAVCSADAIKTVDENQLHTYIHSGGTRRYSNISVSDRPLSNQCCCPSSRRHSRIFVAKIGKPGRRTRVERGICRKRPILSRGCVFFFFQRPKHFCCQPRCTTTTQLLWRANNQSSA